MIWLAQARSHVGCNQQGQKSRVGLAKSLWEQIMPPHALVTGCGAVAFNAWHVSFLLLSHPSFLFSTLIVWKSNVHSASLYHGSSCCFLFYWTSQIKSLPCVFWIRPLSNAGAVEIMWDLGKKLNIFFLWGKCKTFGGRGSVLFV